MGAVTYVTLAKSYGTGVIDSAAWMAVVFMQQARSGNWGRMSGRRAVLLGHTRKPYCCKNTTLRTRIRSQTICRLVISTAFYMCSTLVPENVQATRSSGGPGQGSLMPENRLQIDLARSRSIGKTRCGHCGRVVIEFELAPERRGSRRPILLYIYISIFLTYKLMTTMTT
jgi:hypothetical protein